MKVTAKIFCYMTLISNCQIMIQEIYNLFNNSPLVLFNNIVNSMLLKKIQIIMIDYNKEDKAKLH